MKRVTGIGGLFFKSDNPAMIREWYGKHLGIGMQDQHGAVFTWGKEGTEEKGTLYGARLKKPPLISSQAKKSLCSTTALKTWKLCLRY